MSPGRGDCPSCNNGAASCTTCSSPRVSTTNARESANTSVSVDSSPEVSKPHTSTTCEPSPIRTRAPGTNAARSTLGETTSRMRRFAVNTSALASPGFTSNSTPYVLGGAASASSSWCNTASLSREVFSNSASFAFRSPSSRLARRSTCRSAASISDDVIVFNHLHVVPRHLATLHLTAVLAAAGAAPPCHRQAYAPTPKTPYAHSSGAPGGWPNHPPSTPAPTIPTPAAP